MQKGFAQTLLLLIIAIAVISAFVIYWFNFRDPSEIASDKLVPPTPPTKEQMDQNQIYKNDNLGIEFVVPQNFYVFEENEEQFHKRSNGDMRKNFASYVRYSPAEFVTSLYVIDKNQDFEKSPLSIWVFNNPENLNSEAFYKKYWYYPFIWGDFTQLGKNKIAPAEKFMVGNLEATGAAILDRDPKSNLFYLSRNGKMYLFKVIGSGNILESFKFN